MKNKKGFGIVQVYSMIVLFLIIGLFLTIIFFLKNNIDTVKYDYFKGYNKDAYYTEIILSLLNIKDEKTGLNSYDLLCSNQENKIKDKLIKIINTYNKYSELKISDFCYYNKENEKKNILGDCENYKNINWYEIEKKIGECRFKIITLDIINTMPKGH